VQPSEATLRDGRFALLGLLGEGAQGRTYAGIDKREGRPVAIKRFDVRGARTWKDAELAEREARVLQSLSHPKLPRYIDHFEQDGALYLVMEKIEGQTLASLRRAGSLGKADVVRLLRDASDVLEYLHTRVPPVVHRDIKPGNVIRRPDGSFAFVDFGSVRDTLRPEGGSTVVGTFGYMAPEQFQGRALPASDVYAVGVTALAMLTGRDPENLPHRGLAIDVRTALGRSARGPLADVIERMVDPDPDRRATSLVRLLARLEGRRARCDSESHVSERTPHHISRSQRRAERHARRAARRAAASRPSSRPGRPFLPWPVSLAMTIALAACILAVVVATQIVVPLVLNVLSMVVARRALGNAARAVREGGQVAVVEMSRTAHWLRSEDNDDQRAEPPAWQAARGGGAPHMRVSLDRPVRNQPTGAGSQPSDEDDDAPSSPAARGAKG